MIGPAYYNEFDPFSAQWLRELIREGLIAPGDVDERSIKDVRADDLRGYTQCHFFAGIGGWSYALRLAGWPDHRPVWTASCPCQPFSAASVGHGGAKGQGDDRDLWPVFFPLARQCQPDTILGEQVDEAIRWGWWDRAALDLEGEGYAAAASILRADACQAHHERKRLYWLANAGGEGRQGRKPVERFPFTAQAPFSEYGDTAARARRALDGDFVGLLPCDGLSVVLERHALRCYGNAIHAGTAAQFIQASQEAILEVEGRMTPFQQKAPSP